MNNKFDELAKGMAQSVTRRQALRRFGVGLAGVVLASLELANKAEADVAGHVRRCIRNCVKSNCNDLPPDQYQFCYNGCYGACVQAGG